MATITKSAFVALADILTVKANGQVANGTTKQFSSGSVGFNLSTKVSLVNSQNISRDNWETAAPQLVLDIGGVPFQGNPMVFSSGRLGYNINGKVSKIMSNGALVKFQVSCNPCVPDSLPEDMDEVPAGIIPLQVTVNCIAVKSKEWAD